MSAFGAALDTLFADPNLGRDAVYSAQGSDPVTIRIMARRADQVLDFGDTRVHTGNVMFDVRVSEVPDPASGDVLEIDGENFTVQGEPVRDLERLVWTIDVRPA